MCWKRARDFWNRKAKRLPRGGPACLAGVALPARSHVQLREAPRDAHFACVTAVWPAFCPKTVWAVSSASGLGFAARGPALVGGFGFCSAVSRPPHIPEQWGDSFVSHSLSSQGPVPCAPAPSRTVTALTPHAVRRPPSPPPRRTQLARAASSEGENKGGRAASRVLGSSFPIVYSFQ